MGQRHFDRLSGLDASFLAHDGPSTHMHLVGVVVLEGPAPPFAQVLASIGTRLHLVPRYRHKLAAPPGEAGRPRWVDDGDFALERHVLRAVLPPPGEEEGLMAFAGEVFSRPLDRSRPLWELWVVEGLAGGGFAIVSKNHHALTDGIAGVDLAQVLFDLSPVPPPIRDEPEPWTPRPEPGRVSLLAASVTGAMSSGLRGAGSAVAALARPGHALRTTGRALQGLGEVGRQLLDPAPATPLNVPIGPERRFLGVRGELADFKLVKDTFGGTVNDVVLAVVTGGLRTWLQARGVRTDDLALRALVPVSVRGEADRGALGNRLVAVRGLLPVAIADPLERLEAVVSSMEEIKRSKLALGAGVLTGVQSVVPAAVLAQASRINFSTRLFNLLVTNIPGPQLPLYVQGRRMLDIFPVPFLARDHALAIAAFSYDGRVDFGLLGDHEVLHDLEGVGDGLRDALRELVAVAREQRGVTSAPRVPEPAGAMSGA